MSVELRRFGAQERSRAREENDGKKDVLVSNAGDLPGNRRILGTQSPGSHTTKSKSEPKHQRVRAADENQSIDSTGSFRNVHWYFHEL